MAAETKRGGEMNRPIPTLRGTLTHITAIELYQRHDTTTTTCAACGNPTPCRVRAFAASVIAAAGEIPGWHDTPQAPPAIAKIDMGRTSPEYAGWAIGRRSQRPIPEGLLYERED
ncbi:hypothetical protein ACQPYA_18150 [Micromonospora sp. CA-263727]|uniref:hypothetical protein n=1 Tax=Micromonospora sp. CA-263727 TaxID=3239967 RepID=UPI003D933468